MILSENKNHWYDGKFYDKLIAPNPALTFVQMMRMIEPESKVIDIGCGTGRFVFKIADRAKKNCGCRSFHTEYKFSKSIKEEKKHNQHRIYSCQCSTAE